MLERIMQYIVAQLKQASTYRGLMLIIASVGHWASVDSVTQQQVFMDVGLFIAGIIGAALPDRVGAKNSRAEDEPADQPPFNQPAA